MCFFVVPLIGMFWTFTYSLHSTLTILCIRALVFNYLFFSYLFFSLCENTFPAAGIVLRCFVAYVCTYHTAVCIGWAHFGLFFERSNCIDGVWVSLVHMSHNQQRGEILRAGSECTIAHAIFLLIYYFALSLAFDFHAFLISLFPNPSAIQLSVQ